MSTAPSTPPESGFLETPSVPPEKEPDLDEELLDDDQDENEENEDDEEEEEDEESDVAEETKGDD